ncbi:MAG: secretin and TonB N-terminal domain-containing protein [bacterium]|nr:secretin and TonB N-terminal domain-containing protein [bacterium]
MIRKNLKYVGIVSLMVIMILSQVYAEIKIAKPAVKHESGKTYISIPFIGESITYTSNKYNHLVYLDITDAVLTGAAKYSMPIEESAATKVVVAQYQSEPKVVRAVIMLSKWVPFDIKQEEKTLVICIDNTGVEPPAASGKKAKSVPSVPGAEKVAAPPAVEPKPAVLPPAVEVKPAPTGLDAIVSLDFSGAELPSVIRILADKSGLNIVAGPEVAGKVSIHLENVTVKEALDTILAVHGFTFEKPSPNVLRIVKIDKPVVAPPPAVEEIVEQVTLNYKKTSDVIAVIKSVYPRVNIVEWLDNNAKIITGTGVIVISGSPQDVAKAKALIKKLDKPIKQVMIEARLINLDLDKIKDLGISWDATKSSIIDDGTYSIGGQTLGQAGALAGGIVIGSISTPTWDINATLKAAVENKSAEVLANPRILALNNTTAEINITRQNPYVQWSYDAQTNTYVGNVNFDEKTKEGVTLTVTPQITDDGNILMHIVPVQKSKQGEISYPSAGGAPNTVIAIVDERKADATLLVKDGETVVIGGLRKNNELTKENKIPVLGDIPFLGNAFKSKSTTVSRSELMLFVTPYIVKESTPLTAEEKINYDRIDLK